MSGIFTSFTVSSSGLSAQRRRMDAIASNIANVETTSGPDGSFYKRKRIYFSESKENVNFANEFSKASTQMARTHPLHLSQSSHNRVGNTQVSLVDSKETESGEEDYKLIHDPSHPDSNEEGYVKLPDVNILGEMVDLMVASRAYEANIMAMDASKNMAHKALEI